MKKIMTSFMVCLAAVFASAKTLPDKTNLEQLDHRSLDAGQMAWNEEDGSAVIYIGSPTETKNLRVIDPTALRGYRNKMITSELTISASANVQQNIGNVYRYTCGQDTTPYKYDYELITKEETVKYDEKTGEQTEDYCTFNPATGEYTHVTLPEGFVIRPGSGTDYYVATKYKLVTLVVYSKDANIDELDYYYNEIQGGLMDFPEIKTSRTILYDGRKATISIKVTAGRSQDWFEVSQFSATCIGMGDIKEFVNDVSTNGNLTVMIRDKEGTYNLNNLRHELYHKYDGNRGEHWSNYKARRDIIMGGYNLTFNNTNAGVRAALGISDKTFQINHGDSSFFKFVPPPELSPSSPYYGMECRFTAINYPSSASGNLWTFDFEINRPVPMNFIEVYYVDDLLKTFWNPIECQITDVGNNQMSYHVVVPNDVGIRKMGFFKIKFLVNAKEGHLDLKTTVRLLGDDGHMYKLTFPTGGGTVTATLDD